MAVIGESIEPTDAAEWRAWLKKHHARAKEIWVIYRKTAHGRSMTWSDAVDEALCFGWIDTTAQGIDDKHYAQRFTRRKPGSNWSEVNKKKVAKLIEEGRMTPAGLVHVEHAKKSGEWALSRDRAADVAMPAELDAVLTAKARAAFEALAPGYQKLFRRYVAEAKQAETRVKRAALAVKMLTAGQKNPFGPKPK